MTGHATHLTLRSRSSPIGGALLASLLLGLGLSILYVTGRAVELLAPELLIAGNLLNPLGLLLVGVSVAALVLLLLWLDRLHLDLSTVFVHYPIRHTQAQVLIWMPGYNLYGLFHLYFVLTAFLVRHHVDFQSFDRDVRAWIPAVWTVLAGSLWWIASAISHWPLEAGPYVIGLGILPVLYTLALGMTINVGRAIDHAIQLQAREITL